MVKVRIKKYLIDSFLLVLYFPVSSLQGGLKQEAWNRNATSPNEGRRKPLYIDVVIAAHAMRENRYAIHVYG